MNDLYKLNLNNKRWEAMTAQTGNVPSERHGHTSDIYSGKLILFGGLTDTGATNGIYQFDLSTLTWVKYNHTGDIPSPRFNHASIIWEDTLLIFGGESDNGNTLDDVFAFNLHTYEWTCLCSAHASMNVYIHLNPSNVSTCPFCLRGRVPRTCQR